MAEEKKVRGQIHFRLTPEEAVMIEQKAHAANLSPTMYAKKMAVLGKVKPQIMDKETGKALLPHLSHIGSNLNQLAKVANTEGITLAMAAQLETVQNQFNALWDLLLEGKKPKRENVVVKTITAEEAGAKEEPAKPEAPHCKLCGAELIAGERKKDNAPIWFCPNWKDDTNGKHDIMDREE